MPGGSGPIFFFGGAGGGGGSSTTLLTRPYVPGVLVNDVVYQTALGSVDKASATAAVLAKVLGVVTALDVPAVGMAQILVLGDQAGFLGLVPGEVYILSQAPGGIVGESDTLNPDYPDTTPGSGEVLIEVGIAGSATTLFVRVQDPLFA